jgi:probable rRNA maturation factor
LNIRIFYDNTGFRLKGWKETKRIIEKIITTSDRIPGDLNFIISNDQTLKKINIGYLNHDYLTDVITFDYNDGRIVNGEIYVSIETVKFNANNYKVSLKNELLRVMIHGILHLVGFDDKTESERIRMRAMEDLWLDEGKGKKDER